MRKGLEQVYLLTSMFLRAARATQARESKKSPANTDIQRQVHGDLNIKL